MFCRAAKVLDGMELTSFQIMDVEVSEKFGSLRNRWSAGEVEGGLFRLTMCGATNGPESNGRQWLPCSCIVGFTNSHAGREMMAQVSKEIG